MPWTHEQKLAALLRLPWTIHVERDESEGYLVGRVREVPSALATAEDPKDLERELWESLRVSLEVYLDHGDVPPLPAGASRLPWDVEPARYEIAFVKATHRRGEAWDVRHAFARDATAMDPGSVVRSAEPAAT
jgi:predicted RNase H-like HicB family nuclease